MPAYVGFEARTYNPLSWAIRTLTHSKYSHTFILLTDPYSDPNPKILQASGFSVHEGYLKEEQGKGRIGIVYKIQASDEAAQEAIAYVRKFEGQPYGFFQIIGFIFVLGFRWFRENPITAGIVCSEIVWRFLNALHAHGIDKLDRDTITPGGAEKFILALPNTEVVTTW